MLKKCISLFLVLLTQTLFAGHPIIDLNMDKVHDISNAGHVVGYRFDTKHEPLLWFDNTTTQIGSGKDNTFVFAVNDSGQSVGVTPMGQKVFLASGWDLGLSPIDPSSLPQGDLGSLGGTNSVAHSINNSAQVVGISETTDRLHKAFLWQNGTMTDLGTLGGNYSNAAKINNNSQIIGNSHNSSGQMRSFLWENGDMIDLGIESRWSSPTGINDMGQIVGYSIIENDHRAFLWQDNNLTDIGTLGGDWARAMDINDAGLIVGTSENIQGDKRAFIWDAGEMIDLNTLLAPDSGWILTSATGINNNGWIVGEGIRNGVDTTFMIKVVPEPATIALLGLGMILVRKSSKR